MEGLGGRERGRGGCVDVEREGVEGDCVDWGKECAVGLGSAVDESGVVFGIWWRSWMIILATVIIILRQVCS